MSDINDELNILITGDTASGRQMVANVISDALEEAGFSDVKLVNNIDEPIEREETQTLLDLMHQNRPELFSKAVSVKSRPAPGETDDLTTGSDELDASGDDLSDMVDTPVDA